MIAFVGATCAGKTSLINAFISTILNKKIELLVSNETENTYKFTLI